MIRARAGQRAAAALRAVESGLSLPQRLLDAGFGPDCPVSEH
ncbi:hypothetical protein SAMN04490357_7560 [Streptomyces misionensis]|uniref:Uncharacterized protein n=1 Tax=Streptomyces misionensis TaxID=67331 RepID=A0A1H5HN35_9ACTN|nr:hypothetical protein [Streptomyces misionensis]SEE29413.1 hypothetical protein SAMN04490357_7560 [Streptomyces misionensis]